MRKRLAELFPHLAALTLEEWLCLPIALVFLIGALSVPVRALFVELGWVEYVPENDF